MIYIVEDDPDIREIELFALRSGGWQVEAFDTGRALMRAVEARLPELILLDVMLPDEDGLSILSRLRGRADTRRVPVILVTAKDTEMDKVRGLELGADDYIAKPFSVLEMIARVKALLRRAGPDEGAAVLACGGVVLDADRRMVTADGVEAELTFKEFELLRLLMKNCGIVVSREVIMERVWGSSFEGESRTIDVHVRTLRSKLGACGSIIRTVRNVGYMVQPGR